MKFRLPDGILRLIAFDEFIREWRQRLGQAIVTTLPVGARPAFFVGVGDLVAPPGARVRPSATII